MNEILKKIEKATSITAFIDYDGVTIVSLNEKIEEYEEIDYGVMIYLENGSELFIRSEYTNYEVEKECDIVIHKLSYGNMDIEISFLF